MAKSKNPTKDFLSAVGGNIRHYRQKQGLTLEQLGEDIGLDKGNVHRIEAGKNITLLTLLKIALFLKTDPLKLLGNKVKVSVGDAENLIAGKKRARTRTKSKSKKKSSRKK
jgi:transcriptional regulator with XRE-family HTH domain